MAGLCQRCIDGLRSFTDVNRARAEGFADHFDRANRHQSISPDGAKINGVSGVSRYPIFIGGPSIAPVESVSVRVGSSCFLSGHGCATYAPYPPSASLGLLGPCLKSHSYPIRTLSISKVVFVALFKRRLGPWHRKTVFALRSAKR